MKGLLEMRLLKSRLRKVRLYKNEKQETGYAGTVDAPLFSGFFYAGINESENRYNAELYGGRTKETLTLFCEYPLDALCGDEISLVGKQPTHRIVSVAYYGSYAEICAERQGTEQ